MPGFSNTSENTAFHAAVNDYELKIPLYPNFETFDDYYLKGAPVRTAESLYRHVWKPYLGRIQRGECTENDKLLLENNSLTPFMRGINESDPEPSELRRRLHWFEIHFRKPGVRFRVMEPQLLRFREMLISANVSVYDWREHISLSGACSTSQQRVDEMLNSGQITSK